MIRPRSIVLVALFATLALAGLAQAAVRVQVGVRPDTLAHCDQGRLAFALWNDGGDTLRVRLQVSLVHDTTTLASVALRARLAPRETRGRDGHFVVPPRLPAGRYTIRVAAVASDSSRDSAEATFTVLEGGCSTGDPDPLAHAAVMGEVVTVLGLDVATPALRQTLGAVKRRWDETPGK